MRPGPSPGAVLYARLRRIPAAVAVLALLAATLTTTAPPVPPAASSSTCAACAPDLIVDETAEARDLVAAERATRARRPEPVQQMGTVAQPKRKPVRTDPKPTRTTRREAASAAPVVPVKVSGDIAVVITYALAQRGKPYRWGSAGPGSFDCSGLIMMSYRQIGVRLPHQSGAIAARGRPVPRSQARAGDVAAYPGHVGLLISPTHMVHASRAGVPVKVSAIYGSPRIIRIVG